MLHTVLKQTLQAVVQHPSHSMLSPAEMQLTPACISILPLLIVAAVTGGAAQTCSLNLH